MRWRRLLLWILLGCAAPSGASADDTLWVIATGESDLEVLPHLEALVGTTARSEIPAGDPEEVLRRARGVLRGRHILLLDRSRGLLHVLRPGDGTILTRVLDLEFARESAYAVALAAAELLDVARQTPRAEVITETVPPRGEHRGQEPSGEAAARLGGAVGAGVGIATSPGRDVSLLRAILSGDLRIGQEGSRYWLTLGATVTSPGTWSRVLDAGAAERVGYQRLDASLRVGGSVEADETLGFLWLTAGLGFVEASATTPSGATLGSDFRVGGWLGLALELRQRVLDPLSMGLDLGFSWVPEPTRYLVRGAPVIAEGHLRMTAAISVFWDG